MSFYLACRDEISLSVGVPLNFTIYMHIIVWYDIVNTNKKLRKCKRWKRNYSPTFVFSYFSKVAKRIIHLLMKCFSLVMQKSCQTITIIRKAYLNTSMPSSISFYEQTKYDPNMVDDSSHGDKGLYRLWVIFFFRKSFQRSHSWLVRMS